MLLGYFQRSKLNGMLEFWEEVVYNKLATGVLFEERVEIHNKGSKSELILTQNQHPESNEIFQITIWHLDHKVLTEVKLMALEGSKSLKLFQVISEFIGDCVNHLHTLNQHVTTKKKEKWSKNIGKKFT